MMPKKILVRSGWQTINIGDIAHTPGLLTLLERYLPEVQLTLWANTLDNGVDTLLLDRFPQLQIIRDEADLARAFQDCDFLLHSSGASFVAEDSVARWVTETGKPFGVYGISFPAQKSWQTAPIPDATVQASAALLSQAEFAYIRDSKSLEFARASGCSCPILEFGPDAAFGCDLRDDAAADAFLAANDLEAGRFLCCIPRYRFTPTWLIPAKNRPLDPVKQARNAEMVEHDHAPWREAIVQVARQTDMKVLLCPEDQTQMALGKSILLDKLPADVRERVVWRPDYWLTGEAISTYRRSAGLFGNEMHSPIMCIAHGVPALVGRWTEQTTKGYMWQDIGLDDWLFDLDDAADRDRIVPTVLSLAQDPAAARDRAAAAQARVQARQRQTMDVLAAALARTSDS